MEDQQSMHKHIVGRDLPRVNEALSIRQQVPVRQHRPFGPPRRAGDIEKGDKVIFGARNGCEFRVLRRRDVRQAACTICVQDSKCCSR